MIAIHPKEITGSWDQGYVLDVHTVSTTLIGYDEFGHLEFDTVQSYLGDLVNRLKYKSDNTVISPIVETIVEFTNRWAIRPDAVVPMPPSKQRSVQPVLEIAREVAESLKIPLSATSLQKFASTRRMKDVGDFTARVAALEEAFGTDKTLEGKAVLLFDDLLQSGASMNVAARKLKSQGLVKTVFALALTRTRN